MLNFSVMTYFMLQETYGWNGITNKKKGQKWGQQNFSSLRMKDSKSLSKEYSETLTVEEEITVKGSIDFDKLPPLPSLPKVYLSHFFR